MAAASARTALETADWRRRVFALYARVRAESAPADAHAVWVRGRNDLLAHHPATPLMPDDRASFTGVPMAPYDPAWRFELPILPAESGGFEFATGTDGMVPFERIGRVQIPDAGSLDVWRLTTYGAVCSYPSATRSREPPAVPTAAGGICSTRSRVQT